MTTQRPITAVAKPTKADPFVLDEIERAERSFRLTPWWGVGNWRFSQNTPYVHTPRGVNHAFGAGINALGELDLGPKLGIGLIPIVVAGAAWLLLRRRK